MPNIIVNKPCTGLKRVTVIVMTREKRCPIGISSKSISSNNTSSSLGSKSKNCAARFLREPRTALTNWSLSDVVPTIN